MTKLRPRRGLGLVIRPDRAEALLWGRLRFEARSEAREPLFNRYAGLARSIAARHRYGRDHSARCDAEQWAFEGLLQAIDAYDPLRGPPFSAFARRRITGSVRDGLGRSTELDAQYSQRRRLEQERLRSLKESEDVATADDPLRSLAEIAVGLAVGLMLEGTGLMASESSADTAPSAYDSIAWRQTELRLVDAVERLPEREATVIRQHYMNGLSFTQIAELLSLSKGRVSQLHRAALIKLRKRIGTEK